MAGFCALVGPVPERRERSLWKIEPHLVVFDGLAMDRSRVGNFARISAASARV